jgi:hypothetical protein
MAPCTMDTNTRDAVLRLGHTNTADGVTREVYYADGSGACGAEAVRQAVVKTP